MKTKTIKFAKVLVAMVLIAIMAVPTVFAFAAEENGGNAVSDFIGNLLPTGSNGGDTSNQNQSTSREDMDENTRNSFIENLFKNDPTAPDNVAEAFGIADEAYAASHEYCFAVNTSKNIVIAYKQAEDGTFTKPEKAFVCSCGLASSPTKQGTFKTTDQYRWRALNGGVYGQWATRITGPYLFHSVPYYKKDPSTLETAEYNKLGTNASAGCVRLSVKDAKWIQKHCPAGTIVTIYDGANIREPLAKPEAQKIDPNSPYAGWDPTDPNERNPWKNA